MARPDLQCHYCCNASDVYEYHGQRQQLPQSTTRHVGPAVPARSWPRDYLQTYLLHAISRTRQSAHQQSGCLYRRILASHAARSRPSSTLLHSERAAAVAVAEVQATPAKPAQRQTSDVHDVYVDQQHQRLPRGKSRASSPSKHSPPPDTRKPPLGIPSCVNTPLA